MVTKRTAKSKGSQFEMDCVYNLKKIHPDIIRCGAEGFQMQIDLISEKDKVVFECKRLKGISWNQLVKYYEKLEKVAPKGYNKSILFKSNFQPCLIFFKLHDEYYITTFENEFKIKFEKHKSTRVKK